MKKLTQEQIDARMCMWYEAVEHLGMDVAHGAVEREQASIVALQITRLADQWYSRITESAMKWRKR